MFSLLANLLELDFAIKRVKWNLSFIQIVKQALLQQIVYEKKLRSYKYKFTIHCISLFLNSKVTVFFTNILLTVTLIIKFVLTSVMCRIFYNVILLIIGNVSQRNLLKQYIYLIIMLFS